MNDREILPTSQSSLYQACCHESAPFRADGTGRDIFFEELLHHAEQARSAQPPGSLQLLRRFQQNDGQISQVCRRLAAWTASGRYLPPASEWLLDNKYIIDAVAQEIRTDLPKPFYRELPALQEGSFRGYPRIYELALLLLAFSDSTLTESLLRDTVAEFQKKTALTIGELWALPIMLRLGLFDNLRRLADQIMKQVEDHQAALMTMESALAGNMPTLPRNASDAYAMALAEAIRENDLKPGPINEQMHEWAHTHLADLVQIQHREFCRQAADQVSIGNAVTSLRLLDVINWTDFFESLSVVETILRRDAIYPQQDFATRNRCRDTIERLARGSRMNEQEIAEAALQEVQRHLDDPVRGQVSYPLLGAGLEDIEKKIAFRPRWPYALRWSLLQRPNFCYFGTLLILFLVGLATTYSIARWGGEQWAILVTFVAILPVSEIAVSLLNFLLCRIIPPRTLPRFDFKQGVPEDLATFLVIPALVTKREQIAELLEHLEQHYLVNVHVPMWFGLLTDFADAPAPHLEHDEEFIHALLEGVQRLNQQYCSSQESGGRGQGLAALTSHPSPLNPDSSPVPACPRFFLFHRQRLFNPAEGCWMGWERKRGKLIEFNRLLRGANDTNFEVVSSTLSSVPRIRYVLTLDADTVLPRDAARQMIATLAHPLNRAHRSPDGRSIESGYAVLQPRVSFLYRMGLRSWFARLMTRSAGIDPYSTAVSDTYMDLFGRGNFTGKGLYDVDAFAATAGAAFPENHILSHDLIESNYARCALVTQVEVFDEFPSRYQTYARREHRWIRGDWQLLPWLGRLVPAPHHSRVKNVLPLLERWKIADNLRRSLVPIAMFVLLIVSWTVVEGSWGWTLLALMPFIMPSFFYIIGSLVSSFQRRSLQPLLSGSRFEFPCTLGQSLMQIAFLVDQAWLSMDAIARTLYRMFWSRRLLLEWETAASTEKKFQGTIGQSFRTMWSSVIIAIVVGIIVGWLEAVNLLIASPLLLLWAVSPWIAYAIGRPRTFREKPLSLLEQEALHAIARKTWYFFETFVDATNHWLPPDNYQEAPLGVVAHRTSPTNIGVYLLSALAARDFGYITGPQLIERLSETFGTLEKLPRHQGHFFNWYDTKTLAPLLPAYVSTVDSGNLLGCLLALKHGLLEYANLRSGDEQVVNGGNSLEPTTMHSALNSFVSGLRDTCLVLEQEIATHRGKKDIDLENELRSFTQGYKEFLHVLPQYDMQKLKMIAERMSDQIRIIQPQVAKEAEAWTNQLGKMLEAQEARTSSDNQVEQFKRLAERADRFATEMNFRFLYNQERDLFAIGFNADAGKLDAVHYDLLASEACIISFLAIARGEVPRKHWFQLGRMITRTAGEIGLISWGGTMFEYLMPRLLLSVPPGVLLDQGQRTAIERQIEYGRETGLPWGVSESAFYAFDVTQFYQYQSFGVPGLGLKRGLDRDRVIAPYATLLAVDVFPHKALANLQRLRREGCEGAYGFYEAIDYTESRLPNGEKSCVVRCYMAHHQGMGFLALANRLLGRAISRRLHAEPFVRSAELLLEERIPQQITALEPNAAESKPEPMTVPRVPSRRRIATADTPVPRTHILSNGRYSVMVTNAGTGFSRCQQSNKVRQDAPCNLDVTRWRADATADNLGQFFYIRDRRQGMLWSAAHQPVGKHADEYEVIFALDKADYRRVDNEIETLTEVTVVPDADVEIRRITLSNLGKRTRYLDLTSYCEVVLAEHATDLAHPAFGKLFLETEWLPQSSAIICRRRPRSSDQPQLWAVHVLADDLWPISTWGKGEKGGISFETDRQQFLGRRRVVSDPAAMMPDCLSLSGTDKAVLDPIFAIQRSIKLRVGEQAVLGFTTGVAENREAAIALADRYHSLFSVHRGFELAFAHSRIELQHAHLRADEVHLFQRLAGHLFYPVGPLRAPSETIARNRLGQSGLWGYGISGDVPIALLRLNGPEGIWHLKQLLRAHEYWRSKTLQVDFVVLCENAGGYYDNAYTEALNEIRSVGLSDWLDKPGGIFVRKGSQMPEADRILLLSAARMIIDDRAGTLNTQSSVVVRTQKRHRHHAKVSGGRSKGTGDRGQGSGDSHLHPSPLTPHPSSLTPSNSYGSFSADGKDYQIEPNSADRIPPAPWSNVIANPLAGFVITDSGSGFTWVGNSQLNRLTPWSNDPVSDPSGEVIFIQDDVTGSVWCPTPLPIRDDGPIVVKHSQGYTSFTRDLNGISHELKVGVPPTDPLKISILKLKNTTAKPRQLSITHYVEWVLGTHRTATAQHIVTSLDSVTKKAILAQNPFNPDFPQSVAFAAMDLDNITFSGNRGEVIGRNRSLSAPVCFDYEGLSGQVGTGLDPCSALQGKFTLNPGQERVIIFLLGQAENTEAAQNLILHYLKANVAQTALGQMVEQWNSICSAIQVETPDLTFDLLMNRWLIYQTLSCRMWGRSGFYQSGGAYGFRDQLQDVMALVYARPDIVRIHLLRAASRQFMEGDVQHWWHQPSGNGVRTRFSDDFLWLPYAVCHYITITGDEQIFDELVPYLQAELLPPDRHEMYGPATVSETPGTLYEHCVRSLHHGWKLGPHGLPLMGCGDWNDGMNRIGIGGKGESVWVAWFQIVCLTEFSQCAEKRGDESLATECQTRISHLQEAIQKHAWDGLWYRRAYFDDGTPLGSITNQECQIDSLAQTWAVIADSVVRKQGSWGRGQESFPITSHPSPFTQNYPERTRQAMDEVLNRLVLRDKHLVLLFDPPFDTASPDPGYIKGYLPGIRENGGQYTHAACWVVQALTLLGRGNDAYRVFEMLNPIRLTQSVADVNRYRDEPYVIAADVYHHQQHVGRAGWSWYTGSAAWYYRVGLENILGFQLRKDRLYLYPVIPAHWSEFRIRFRYGRNTIYHIEVHRLGDTKPGFLLDGVSVADPFIKLADDGKQHTVVLRGEVSEITALSA